MSTAAMSAPAIATSTAAPRPGSVRWALTRAEGRRLVTHPLFLFGLATSLTALVLADSFATERAAMLSGDCFVMLGAAMWTFIVTFLAVSREPRDDARDFYRAQPAPARIRCEAALLSVGFAGLAAAGLIAIVALVTAGVDGVVVIDPVPHAGQPLPERTYALQPVELAQGPMYVTLAGVLGVLLGSWTRHVFAGVFAALLAFLPPVALLPRYVFDHGESSGFFGSIDVYGADAWQTAGWYLVTITGLILLAAALAQLRHERSTRVVLLLLTGCGVLATGALSGPTLVH
jgi:hypothetical protein